MRKLHKTWVDCVLGGTVLFFASLLIFCSACKREQLVYKVMKVYDGDTLLVTNCFETQSNTELAQSPQTSSDLSRNRSELGLRARGGGVYSGVNEQAKGERNDAMSDFRTSLPQAGCAEEKVRLIGLDTPELAQKPWGEKVQSALLKELPIGSKVYLEYDVEPQDKYGRKLGYIYSNGGELINEWLLKNGYAEIYTFTNNRRYLLRFKHAEALARNQELNIWHPHKGLKQSPSQFRKKHKREFRK